MKYETGREHRKGKRETESYVYLITTVGVKRLSYTRTNPLTQV